MNEATETKPKHTPQWEYRGHGLLHLYRNGIEIGRIDNMPDADFIVRACNSHDKLLEACAEALVTFFYETGACRGCRACGKPTPFPGAAFCSEKCATTWERACPDVRDMLKSAIAATKRGSHD